MSFDCWVDTARPVTLVEVVPELSVIPHPGQPMTDLRDLRAATFVYWVGQVTAPARRLVRAAKVPPPL